MNSWGMGMREEGKGGGRAVHTPVARAKEATSVCSLLPQQQQQQLTMQQKAERPSSLPPSLPPPLPPPSPPLPLPTHRRSGRWRLSRLVLLAGQQR